MRPVVNEATCVACGTCAAVCTADPVVFEVTDVSRVVHPEACLECNECVASCPTASIELIED